MTMFWNEAKPKKLRRGQEVAPGGRGELSYGVFWYHCNSPGCAGQENV